MKKYSLFKVVFITLLVLGLLSWILPYSYFYGSEITTDGMVRMGIFNYFYYFLTSLGSFANIMLFVLVVGGFYGIVNETDVYQNLLKSFASKFKKKEEMLLVAIMILFGVLAVFLGMNIGLFLIIPFAISLILLLGYDKIVALSATVGAVLVGALASFFEFSGAFYIEQGLSADTYGEILSKVGLFLIAMFVLVAYTINYARGVKGKKVESLTAGNKDDLLYEAKPKTKKSYRGLIVIFSAIAFFMLMGFVPWENVFGLSWFTDFNDWFYGLSIGEFAIFSDLVGAGDMFGFVSPFGYFTIEHLTIITLIMTAILALVYRVKIDDVIKGYYEGVKKVIPVALFAVVIPVALIIVATHGYGAVVADWFMGLFSGAFKLVSVGLTSIVGSVFYVQLPYSFLYNLNIVQFHMIDYENMNLVYFTYQVFHGLAMFIAPTSIVLLMGLAYTKVSYVKWFKYVWKLLLMLLGIVVAVLLIAALV